MVYAGVDLHKKYSVVTVVDEMGSVMKQEKLPNREKDIIEFFHSLGSDMSAVVEATSNWYWFSDLLDDHGIELKLAHPLKTKAIASAKIKTDKLDSQVLAHLLRTDFLAEAYIPDKETRMSKELFRNRAFLVKLRNALKGRIHAILAKLNIEQNYSDLFGRKGRAFLNSLNIDSTYRSALDSYLRILDLLELEINEFSKEIKEKVSSSKEARILMSIPGVGPHFALLILSEIGDIKRFYSSKKLVSFAGLCPSTYSSGGKTFHGKIIKQGSKWLRWAMIEAALGASRYDPTFNRIYEGLKKRKGAKVARVAIARKLLENIFHMLKKEETFDKSVMRMGRAR